MIFKFKVEIFNFARHVLDKESLPAVNHDNKIIKINQNYQLQIVQF